MSPYDPDRRRRFYRSTDHAVIGGVCAGLADYFGFKLKVIRILAVCALLVAMPATLIAYFGAVFLVPSRASKNLAAEYDPGFRQALRSDPVQTLSDVRRKYQGLDSRLARLERFVTSPRYNLEQEFKRL